MTAASLPRCEPLTPEDCDVRGLGYMPLDVVRFLKSDLVNLCTPAEGWAALQLWLNSWLEVPAASLLDNERVLARAAGLSLSEWRDVEEMALRGWMRADNGRIYHPHVAVKANLGWIGSLRLRQRSAAANLKQGRSAADPASFDGPIAACVEMIRRVDPDVAIKVANQCGRKRTPTGSPDEANGVEAEDQPGPPETPGWSGKKTSGQVVEGPWRGEETRLVSGEDQPGPAGRPTGGRNRTEVEVEVEDIGGRPRKRGSRLPDDWEPSAELIAYGVNLGFSHAKVLSIAERFRLHWHASAGRNAVKLDWHKAFQGWLREDAEKLPSAKPKAGVW